MSEDLAEEYNRRWQDKQKRLQRETWWHFEQARLIREREMERLERKSLSRCTARNSGWRRALLAGCCIGFAVAAVAAALLFFAR